MGTDPEPASADEPCLSVVIPTYNGRELLSRCLASVMSYRPAGTEVIVVDDGSTDGTTDWLRRAYPEVVLIVLERNQGFCKAINAGIRAARGMVVETLNNDAVVTAGWAEPALDLFDDPRVGSVAPLVWLLAGNGLIDSAGDLYHICGRAMNRGHRQTPWPALFGVAEIFGASASAAFYRRKTLLRVGGFPEHFGAYYDDVDLAFRIRYAGFISLFTPQSQVYHQLHASYDHATPQVLHRLSLNEELVFWTNLPGAVLRRALPVHLLYVLRHGLEQVFDGKNGLAYVVGKLSVMREYHTICRGRRERRRLERAAAHPVSFPLEADNSAIFPLLTDFALAIARHCRYEVMRLLWARRLFRTLRRALQLSRIPSAESSASLR